MTVAAPAPMFDRLPLTGAAAGPGRELHSRLRRHCGALHLSDIADLGAAALGEELAPVALETPPRCTRCSTGATR